MTAQDLKNSILQLAIQGKLVEQRAEEGTARELIEQIEIEKERLTKKRKLKKEKPLPKITKDEIPFEIPESWEWVKLGDMSSYAHPKQKICAKDIDKEMWSLDLEDIEKDTGKIISILRASERKISGDKIIFKKGDILYSKLRPYLLKILVAPNDGICTTEFVPFDTYGEIENEYIMWVLKAPYINYIVNSVSYGVKMPRVGTETMINLLIPLPPLVEQKRIVKKIEELLPYIEKYDKAYSKLEILNSKFPGDMKKSILQYAMQGKLVGQKPEEGTADELYEQIMAEKARLIKEGKIKKEKSLHAITEDEIPYEIPDSWKWVSINDIAFVTKLAGFEYTKYMADAIMPYGEVPIVRAKNIKPNSFMENKNEFITMELSERLSRCALDTKCVLMTFIGAGIGEAAVFDNIRRNHLAPNVAKIVPYVDINYFLMYYLMSSVGQLQIFQYMKQTAQPSLSMEVIRKVLIPLPPLAEQKRIVLEIEKMMQYCEKMVY